MEIVQEKFDRKLKEELEKEFKKETNIIKKEFEKKFEKEKLTQRITMIWKKCARDKSLATIADEKETEPEEVLPIYNLIIDNPEKTVNEIYTLFVGTL